MSFHRIRDDDTPQDFHAGQFVSCVNAVEYPNNPKADLIEGSVYQVSEVAGKFVGLMGKPIRYYQSRFKPADSKS